MNTTNFAAWLAANKSELTDIIGAARAGFAAGHQLALEQIGAGGVGDVSPVRQASGEPDAWIRHEWNKSGGKSLVFEKPEVLSLAEQATGVVYEPLYLPDGAPQAALLVRDVAEMVGVSVPEVCTAVRTLGYGEMSTNMAIHPVVAVGAVAYLRKTGAFAAQAEGGAA